MEQHIDGIPDGNWSFDTWLDGRTFRWISTESGNVCGYTLETAPCGCCSGYVDQEWEWSELSEEEQEMILDEFRGGHFR